MLTIAYIGFGNSVIKYHLPFIKDRDDILVKYVYRRMEDRNTPFELQREKKYPTFTFTSDLDVVLNDESVDCVIINTPDQTHAMYAKKVLHANKHVLVEKPFTLTVKEAKEIFELANKKELVCYVNQNRRYDTDFLSLKEAISSNKLGELIQIESYYNYKTPQDYKIKKRELGWFLFSLGIHNVDQMISCFGKPTQVDYDIRSFVTEHAEDYFTITLNYNKLSVKVTSSLFAKIQKPRFYVEATNGCFIKYPQGNLSKVKLEEPISYPMKPEDESNYGKIVYLEDNNLQEQAIVSKTTDYGKVYTDLINCIKHKHPPVVTQQQVLTTLEIIENALNYLKE